MRHKKYAVSFYFWYGLFAGRELILLLVYYINELTINAVSQCEYRLFLR